MKRLPILKCPDEVEYLQKNFHRLPNHELAQALGRGSSSVEEAASKLSLRKGPEFFAEMARRGKAARDAVRAKPAAGKSTGKVRPLNPSLPVVTPSHVQIQYAETPKPRFEPTGTETFFRSAPLGTDPATGKPWGATYSNQRG